jgi:hypothetical protein
MTRNVTLLMAAASASYALEHAQARRDAAIRKAFADGWSSRAIAREVGLSHARVWQLVTGDDVPRRSVR